MRRLLITITAIIVLLGLIVGIYFLFFASSAPSLSTTTGTTIGTDNTQTTAQNAAEVGVSSQGAGMVIAPNLVMITNSPVAAGTIAMDVSATTTSASARLSTTTSDSSDVKVRYIDRQSGNVYEYGAISRTLTRLSNKTLPGVQEASWVSNGSTAFVRFLTQSDATKDLNTYALPYDGNGGYFLQQNLAQAFVTSANTLFTLAAGTDSSVGTTAHADGTNAKTLFTSPLASLVVSPAGASFVATTRAAATLAGYAFSINSSGAFTPILGPLNGLTTLPSPSGKMILFSYTDGTSLHMSVLNLIDGSVVPLPLATITSKCAWTSDSSSLYCGIPTAFSGTLPDDWYQGAVSFNDRLWKIDLASRLATLVLDPNASVKAGIDMSSLTIDRDAHVILFMNKKDSTLWAYSL